MPNVAINGLGPHRPGGVEDPFDCDGLVLVAVNDIAAVDDVAYGAATRQH